MSYLSNKETGGERKRSTCIDEKICHSNTHICLAISAGSRSSRVCLATNSFCKDKKSIDLSYATNMREVLLPIKTGARLQGSLLAAVCRIAICVCWNQIYLEDEG